MVSLRTALTFDQLKRRDYQSTLSMLVAIVSAPSAS